MLGIYFFCCCETSGLAVGVVVQMVITILGLEVTVGYSGLPSDQKVSVESRHSSVVMAVFVMRGSTFPLS